MLGGIAKTIFGSSNDRYVKSLGAIVNKINAFEPTLQALDDAALANQTVLFRERLAERREARRHPARSVRDGARGVGARARACAISTSR